MIVGNSVANAIGPSFKKIEADPGNPRLIVNVWGVGYRFEGEKP